MRPCFAGTLAAMTRGLCVNTVRMESIMKVTVVIPNYNGQKFIKTCLDALRLQSLREFETLVIDNASQDGSYEYVKEHYPEVKLIRLKKNYGFSAAVNKGITLSETPYVILLNNDTEVAPHFVEELVKAIEASEDIFSVSSKMINFTDRTVMDDAGDLYSIFGWGFQRGVGQPVENFTENDEIFSACAGAAIYRKKVFEEIGLFDLKHFAYLEDMDLGYRARIRGYRNLYCAKAIVYHVGSGTSGSKYNDFKVRLAARNNIYMIYKNMPFVQLALNMPFLALGFLVKYGFFKKLGFGEIYKEGLKEGLEKMHTLQKVPYESRYLSNYIEIEKQLLYGAGIYVRDYLRRHSPSALLSRIADRLNSDS